MITALENKSSYLYFIRTPKNRQIWHNYKCVFILGDVSAPKTEISLNNTGIQ